MEAVIIVVVYVHGVSKIFVNDNFRMRKEHFQQLATLLALYIERKTSTMRAAIRPCHRVAIAIYALDFGKIL